MSFPHDLLIQLGQKEPNELHLALPVDDYFPYQDIAQRDSSEHTQPKTLSRAVRHEFLVFHTAVTETLVSAVVPELYNTIFSKSELFLVT